MLQNEKDKIIELKKEGASYRDISKQLNIPLGTIKSFLSRNGLKETFRCKHCGKELVMVPGKKKKQYCDDNCRMEYWKNHRHLLNKKANYNIVCKCCGKAFIAYGAKDRKYCSIACFRKDKFGHEE